MATVLAVGFILATIAWSAVAVLGMLGLRSLRRLPLRDRAESAGRVSIIVPSRDEADRLAETVRRLLAQRDVEIEVIVVDDRSSDATPEMLAELAAADSRLQVERIESLPEGWLGKCHACHRGVQRATGDWLLFVDADSWLGPDVVARTLDAARREDVDHICLVPGLGDTTLSGQAPVALISLGLLGIAFGLERNLPFGYVGVGAYTLIRREVYTTVGGHERLRMEVIEDFAMGWFVRQAGFRTRLFDAIPDFEVRWAHSARSFVQVLEKNLFAKLGYQLWRASAQGLVLILLWALPLLGAVLATPAGLCAIAAMGLVTLPAMGIARRHGWSILPGLLAPLSLPLLAVAACNSVLYVVKNGGIRWRDTFYPVADLRAGAARLD